MEMRKTIMAVLVLVIVLTNFLVSEFALLPLRVQPLSKQISGRQPLRRLNLLNFYMWVHFCLLTCRLFP